MTALQKLVSPNLLQAYLQQGIALLTGSVVRIADVLSLQTPASILDAYGLPGAADATSVDVLRFESAPLTRLTVPEPSSPAGIAGFTNGFLPARSGDVVPVWDIAPTEVPRDAELWRIHADGRQELVSAYGGPAFGWRSSGVFLPPSMTIGPRAEWNGLEFPIAWIGEEQVELVAVADEAPDGFEQTRPRVFRRVVSVDECARIFDVAVTARWRGEITCTVVQSDPVETSILLDLDADRAAELGAVALEPGVAWLVVPRAEIEDVRGVTNELVRA